MNMASNNSTERSTGTEGTTLSLNVPDIVMEARVCHAEERPQNNLPSQPQVECRKSVLQQRLCVGSNTHSTIAPIVCTSPVATQNESYVRDFQFLLDQLKCLLNEDPAMLDASTAATYAEDSKQPFLWAYRWLKRKHSDEFGYQLSNNSIGLLFSDKTQLLLLPHVGRVCIIDSFGVQAQVYITAYPAGLNGKICKLLDYKNCLENYLPNLGPAHMNNSYASYTPAQLPYVHTYFHSHSYVGMLFTNGTMQISYMDGSTILFCGSRSLITCIDQGQRFTTYRLINIMRYGCTEDMFDKLKTARGLLETLLLTVFNKT